jgi:phosphoglycerate kinase
MQIKNLDNVDVKGKFVLLRDDFNVQIMDGKITDAFRIEQSMPTLRKLQAGGARVAILAHLGRPKGQRNMEYSLTPVAEYMKVPLIPDCLDKGFMAGMKDGDVVLLENVRFYPGEEKNDAEFAAKLADGFDVFVNDAFAVSHRAHASTVGVAKILPSYAGELLASEIRHLAELMENPKRPLLAIVAGSKVSTKLNVLKTLVKMSDKLIVGGAIGTTFNYALGEKVGNSLFEPDMKDTALEIIELAKQHGCELMLPIDKGTALEFDRNAQRATTKCSEMSDADIILDAGIRTTERNISAIKSVKTVVWNGTVGMAEWFPVWSYGSFSIARALALETARGNIESIVGGGDTVAALEETGTKDDISYVSTGGGAFLEFIEGQELPGIKVLEI